LPSPYKPNCILEDAIARRKSIREFTKDEISLENLSAILWAAYNIESVKNAVKTYVLMKDGVYVYIPSKHSLKLYRKGDFGWMGEHDTAYLKLAFVWNKSLCKNESIAAFQIGTMGQNAYFMANCFNWDVLQLLEKEMCFTYLDYRQTKNSS